MIIRKSAPSAFQEAPSGTSHGLFIPAVHECNETHLKEYLKKYPEQGKHTEGQAHIQRSLGIVHDVLLENDLPTILEGGSTLGFFRNCGVIPGDHDGDVALLGNWIDKDKIADIKKSFEARNATLGEYLCPSGPGHSGCELRASFQDSSYVDLLVYASQDECTQAPCNYFSSLWAGGSTDDGYFYPCDTGPIHFEQASFLDRTFWIQAPTLDYLKGQYGEVWEDPAGGVYKSCHFDKHNKPEADDKAGRTPPASYVVMLQKESEKERELAKKKSEDSGKDSEKPETESEKTADESDTDSKKSEKKSEDSDKDSGKEPEKKAEDSDEGATRLLEECELQSELQSEKDEKESKESEKDSDKESKEKCEDSAKDSDKSDKESEKSDKKSDESDEESGKKSRSLAQITGHVTRNNNTRNTRVVEVHEHAFVKNGRAFLARRHMHKGSQGSDEIVDDSDESDKESEKSDFQES